MLQVVERPPAQLVDDVQLEVGPAGPVLGGECGGRDPREEEHLVLAAVLGVEVEDGRAREHRTDEILRGQHDAGLLPDLAQRGTGRVLPVVDTAADREPPAAVRLVLVVPADQQDAVGLVEEDDPCGLAEEQAVVTPPPLRSQAVHGPPAVGTGASRDG